jgi:hypothetical protein
LFQGLGGLVGGLGGFGELLLLSVAGQLLLEFSKVGLALLGLGLLLGIVVGLLRVIGLALLGLGLLLGIVVGLLLGHVGLLGLFGGALGLFDGLLELLGGVVGVEALGLEGSLVVGFFAAFLVELFLDLTGGLLEFVGGLLGLLGGRLGLVFLEVVAGLLLVLLGLLDGLGSLLQRLSGLGVGGLLALGHLLKLLLDLAGGRLELFLFLGQVTVLFGLLGLLGFVGDVAFVFGEFFELVFQFFESGDVFTALVDGLELAFEGLLGTFEGLEGALLVRLGLAGILGVEFILGLLHGLGGLLEGLLEGGIGGQGSLLELLGVLVRFLLQGLGEGQAVGVLFRALGGGVGVLLLLDEFVEALCGLFYGSAGIDLRSFGGGNTAVDLFFGLLEFIEGLLLGLLGLVEFALAQGVFGLPLLIFDRFEQVGDFAGRIFGGFAGITGGEFGFGLLIGEVLAAQEVGVHSLAAGLFELFGVSRFAGLLLDFLLGVDGALEFLLGLFEGGDRVRRWSAQGVGQVLEFLGMAALTVCGQFPLPLAEQGDGALQLLEQTAGTDGILGLFQAVFLLRSQVRNQVLDLLEEGGDFGAEVLLFVGQFQAIISEAADAAAGEAGGGQGLGIEGQLFFRGGVQASGGFIQIANNVQLDEHAAQLGDDLALFGVSLLLGLGLGLGISGLLGRHCLFQVPQDLLDLLLAEFAQAAGDLFEHFPLQGRREPLVGHGIEGGAGAPGHLCHAALDPLLLLPLLHRVRFLGQY